MEFLLLPPPRLLSNKMAGVAVLGKSEAGQNFKIDVLSSEYIYWILWIIDLYRNLMSKPEETVAKDKKKPEIKVK